MVIAQIILGSSWKRVGRFEGFRVIAGQHAGEYLQAEVFLITQAIGARLQYTDLVVETFDEAEGDLVLGLQ